MSHAQEWFPLGAQWTYGYSDYFLGLSGYVTHVVTGDSVVDGRPCRVLQCTRTRFLNGNPFTEPLYPYRYLVYDTAGTVFIHTPDAGFDTLYAMNAGPGDRWSLVPLQALCDTAAYMEVLDTGHVAVDDVPLRWLATELRFPNADVPWVLPDTIVERLGSRWYLTPQAGCAGWDMIIAGSPLRCYGDQELAYMAPGLFVCEPTVGVEERGICDRIRTHWSGGTLTIIASSGSLQGGVLFDGSGRPVQRAVPEAGLINFDCSALAQGIYCYSVQLDHGQVGGHFVRE